MPLVSSGFEDFSCSFNPRSGPYAGGGPKCGIFLRSVPAVEITSAFATPEDVMDCHGVEPVRISRFLFQCSTPNVASQDRAQAAARVSPCIIDRRFKRAR